METNLQPSIEKSKSQTLTPKHTSTEESDTNGERDSHEDILSHDTTPTVPNISKEYKNEEREDYHRQPLDCSTELSGTLLQPKTERTDHMEDNSETETSDMDTIFEPHSENVHKQGTIDQKIKKWNYLNFTMKILFRFNIHGSIDRLQQKANQRLIW